MSHEGKKNIRQAIKRHFGTLSVAQKEACAERIFAKVEALEPFAQAHTVALYHALPDELPTATIIEKWSKTKRIVLPCVEGETMVFRTLCGHTRRGCFGIEEPLGEIVPPSQIDLMIVPGVAFDVSGHRLGRGKGFYDRFLAECDTHIYSVGVCFPFQLVENLPCEPHDQPVDIVITANL